MDLAEKYGAQNQTRDKSAVLFHSGPWTEERVMLGILSKEPEGKNSEEDVRRHRWHMLKQDVKLSRTGEPLRKSRNTSRLAQRLIYHPVS